MRPIDVRHLGTERVICSWEHDGVVVDPGPESCLETLLAELGPEPPRAVLLTHIHFDHAGAAGALARRFGIPVHVHERGARHLVDPSRLVASATRLYGEDGMRRLWGEVVPVPEEHLVVLRGGETVLGHRVAYTPGHASHHVCYLHEDTGHAFCGDMAGVRIGSSDVVVAPTPPPDIDLDAWNGSLDVLAGWRPAALCLTHFGLVEDVDAQLEATREALRREAELAAEHDVEGFVAAMTRDLAARMDEPTLASYVQAAPLDHLWLGLDRWRSRQAAAG
jgi:glyoxylase-like metal-dependent hydrolase (beta-lactamase superfamily II)